MVVAKRKEMGRDSVLSILEALIGLHESIRMKLTSLEREFIREYDDLCTQCAEQHLVGMLKEAEGANQALRIQSFDRRKPEHKRCWESTEANENGMSSASEKSTIATNPSVNQVKREHVIIIQETESEGSSKPDASLEHLVDTAMDDSALTVVYLEDMKDLQVNQDSQDNLEQLRCENASSSRRGSDVQDRFHLESGADKQIVKVEAPIEDGLSLGKVGDDVKSIGGAVNSLAAPTGLSTRGPHLGMEKQKTGVCKLEVKWDDQLSSAGAVFNFQKSATHGSAAPAPVIKKFQSDEEASQNHPAEEGPSKGTISGAHA